MNVPKVVAVTSLLMLALGSTVVRAAPASQSTHVDIMESCKKGLVAWQPFPKNPKCGGVGTPQVKVFDDKGQLRFIGTALESIQWVKAGQPSTPIPKDVLVRDIASEVRITHVAAPQPGRSWVTYYSSKDCEPCDRQLTVFRSEVLPKIGAGASIAILDLGE